MKNIYNNNINKRISNRNLTNNHYYLLYPHNSNNNNNHNLLHNISYKSNSISHIHNTLLRNLVINRTNNTYLRNNIYKLSDTSHNPKCTNYKHLNTININNRSFLEIRKFCHLPTNHHEKASLKIFH